MVGLNNQYLRAKKNEPDCEDNVQRGKILKNFNAAMLHDNIKKLKKVDNLTDEAKVQFLERPEASDYATRKDSWRFGHILNQKNMIEVLKHVAALAFILVILYIMYLVLDMAFGPKKYKSKKYF